MCSFFRKKQSLNDSTTELEQQLKEALTQKEIIEKNIEEIQKNFESDENKKVTEADDKELKEEAIDKDTSGSDESTKLIKELQSKITEQSNEIIRLNNELSKAAEKSSDSLLLEEINKISAMISERNEIAKENEYLHTKLDEKQERLEQIVHNCQEDRYRKDKGRLINRIIYQMDLIRNVIYDFDNEHPEDLSASVAFLRQQFLEIITYMEETLRAESVECIRLGKDGSAVDLELQEVTDVVITDKPELAGKVHRSIHPGYTWRLPYILKAKIKDDGSVVKDYDFLIRPEQVITYKLNK
ncbi:MAG: hypothetical protein E7114_06135 [Bacteroidales bacterium]|nr:hypothetical protein [Bacteroidales bacterium]MBO5075868.1 hypothetical protein [Bacteroidales bacterium]